MTPQRNYEMFQFVGLMGFLQGCEQGNVFIECFADLLLIDVGCVTASIQTVDWSATFFCIRQNASGKSK
jgi:hypothetical protein